MKRRSFTTRRRAFMLGATAGLFVPVNARAQKRRRIGALLVTPPGPVWAVFLDGLRAFGWVEGNNLEIIVRASGGDQRRVPELAAELLNAEVDLVVATDTPSSLALLRRTRTVPIITVGSADPVAAGLVSSLARPGGNVTGVSADLNDLASKYVEFSRELVPGLRRVAVMFNPENPLSVRGLQMFETSAATVSVEVTHVPVATSEQLETALSAIARERPQVLVVHPAQPIGVHSVRIAEFAIRQGIPTLGPGRNSVRDGHLLYYGPSSEELMRRAAYYVNRILRGTAPSDLPVEQVTARLTINLATARALGLTIPPAILARADEVIE